MLYQIVQTSGTTLFLYRTHHALTKTSDVAAGRGGGGGGRFVGVCVFMCMCLYVLYFIGNLFLFFMGCTLATYFKIHTLNMRPHAETMAIDTMTLC